ncbi:3187_t:CDS:2 [Diversispora eburnea]|uniref:3187_t:CDS:1 n=1 Tax=Diversispora eburnea TaxID=1213867 RepID=A0A9N9CAT9_9GLOM|nr:3187_t:CDS:2 [Diversispora eburnea]
MALTNESSIKIQKCQHFIWKQLELLIYSPTTTINVNDDQCPDNNFSILDEKTALEKLNSLKSHIEEKRRELNITDFEFHAAFHGPEEVMKFQMMDVIAERDAQLKAFDEFFQKDCSNPKIFEDQTLCPEQIKSIVMKTLFQQLKIMFFKDKNIDKIVILRETNQRFREILTTEKFYFSTHLSNVEYWLGEALKVLQLDDEQFTLEKYNKFQNVLLQFLEGISRLMEYVQIIWIKCKKETKNLEKGKENLKIKLWCNAVNLVIYCTGYMMNKEFLNNFAVKLGLAVVGTGFVTGVTILEFMTLSIERQEKILTELKGMHKELLSWKSEGEKFKLKDFEDINQESRNDFVAFFRDYKDKCKSFRKTFEMEV